MASVAVGIKHHFDPITFVPQQSHEVLGIASGSATVRFGGEGGEIVGLTTSDVVVIPAGVGHALINQNGDLLVVGAYADGRDWDLLTDDPQAIVAARQRIAQVPLPSADPVDGANGPLMKLWGCVSKTLTLASSQRDDVVAIPRIAQVPLPSADPVDGANGPLMKLWGCVSKTLTLASSQRDDVVAIPSPT